MEDKRLTRAVKKARAEIKRDLQKHRPFFTGGKNRRFAPVLPGRGRAKKGLSFLQPFALRLSGNWKLRAYLARFPWLYRLSRHIYREIVCRGETGEGEL